MSEKTRKKGRPEAVSGLLHGVFSHKPLARRLSEGKIWLVWNSAVGKQIAAQAQPVNFRDGVLTVLVSNAPWMQQLNFLKPGIIEKLNSALGEELVKEIFLRAGRPQTPLSPGQGTARKAAKSLSETEIKRVAEETSCLEDPDLREAFAALFAQHLSNKGKETD